MFIEDTHVKTSFKYIVSQIIKEWSFTNRVKVSLNHILLHANNDKNQ